MNDGPVRPISDFAPLTDGGNGERLAQRFAGVLRYVEDRQEWRTWTAPVWMRDDMGPVWRACLATARAVHEEAAELSTIPNVHPLTGKAGPSDRDKMIAHAISSESRRAAESMMAFAAHMPPISCHAIQFDPDPWLLNTPTAVIDLRDGSTRLPAPELMQSHVTSARYRPDRKSELWESFIRTITCDDRDLALWLQRAIGMSLIGVQRDHVFIFCFGGGRNGKGTFLNTICRVLGDYAQTLPPNMLVEKKNEHHSTEIADLEGRRFAVGSEVPRGAAWDEVLIKMLTGGDRIRAHKMRKDHIEFEPSHTFWVSGNDKPRIRGVDAGIWRRMRLVPFLAKISKESEDVDFGIKLFNEGDAVLAWALEGCRMYLQHGLGSCTAIDEATAQYRADEDILGTFLADSCCVVDGLRVLKTDFRNALREWMQEREYKPMTDKTLKADMLARGFSESREGGIGPWQWTGLNLRSKMSVYELEALTL